MDTALGNPIRNFQAPELGHPLAAAAIEAKVRPPSEIRANAHPRYNCHGLTFGSRRSAINEEQDILLAAETVEPPRTSFKPR
jgi:hypothetical protein